MTQERGTRIHVEVPTPLHTDLKVAAAERQITLKQAVIEAIRDWVARRD